MDENRRNFLKIAGASAVGLAWGIPVVSAIAKAFKTEKLPGARSAERWALIIDTDKCKASAVQRACSEACHQIHNVPTIDNKRHEIKWIWDQKYYQAFPFQTHEYTADNLKNRDVLILCNHCKNPPCVRVCPTGATFKRSDGIVMMDQHRCIGCRYCMAACPYGARSFNWKNPRDYIKSVTENFPTRTKGVVEKCNFCAERLARGKNPACVEAANRVGGPGAMVFGDLADPGSEVARVLRRRHTIRRKPGLGTEPQVYYVV